MERLTISLDDPLAASFDEWLAGRGYTNRSEAMRDLIRAELERSRQQEAPRRQGVGVLSYVFHHRYRELGERIVGLEHAYHDTIVSSIHANLDAERSIEAVILRGAMRDVRRFSDAVCAHRGVHHGQLNIVSAQDER
ncbi:MAG: nickel-responsive transcriptional regulator NikR [Proteobacteria bacterium]|jgi:CopG family nickel-responsive transcriptional regulator|nr:nickel-responsive transcriptional regulator NikR [Pseudomonadota bacterium]